MINYNEVIYQQGRNHHTRDKNTVIPKTVIIICSYENLKWGLTESIKRLSDPDDILSIMYNTLPLPFLLSISLLRGCNRVFTLVAFTNI